MCTIKKPEKKHETGATKLEELVTTEKQQQKRMTFTDKLLIWVIVFSILYSWMGYRMTFPVKYLTFFYFGRHCLRIAKLVYCITVQIVRV